jgi:hypothetical protein
MVAVFQVKVLWVVMPHSDVVGYQHFRGPSSSWCHNPEDLDFKFNKEMAAQTNKMTKQGYYHVDYC